MSPDKAESILGYAEKSLKESARLTQQCASVALPISIIGMDYEMIAASIRGMPLEQAPPNDACCFGESREDAT
jgi:hypothetical protein